MNYKESGTKILSLVGGKENVLHLTHCLTRLRFNLKETQTINKKELEDLPYVLGVVENEKDFQVIIGTDVENFYRPISELVEESTQVAGSTKKGSIGAVFIDTVSGIFTPILPALTAAGMLQAVLALLVAFKVVENTSQTYQILNFMGNTTFYFLPVLLAASAADKFKCNKYIAMMLGAMIIHPNFISMVAESIETGQAIRFAGLPVYNATYTSSVIPVILGVLFMSKVEPIADRVSPKAVKFFTKPLLTILITGLATLMLIGPIGYIISSWITDGVNFLNGVAGWIVPTLIGAGLPFLVMTGIHHGLTAVGINNRMVIGYDTMAFPGQLASNVAQGAAGFAVMFKTKNKQLKQIAAATSLTAMCGITEPVLFGLTMKVKTNLIATAIGGGVGGFFFGIFGVKNYAGGAPGLLTLPSYIGLNAPLSNFYLAIAGTVIGSIVSFVVAYILFKDPIEEEQKIVTETVNTQLTTDTVKNDSLINPVNGEVVSLSTVNDFTFAEGLMGKGVAIQPSEGTIYAPTNGKIVNVFPTKHAITLLADSGAEIIIHIGIDTVNLKGKYFETFVEAGATVKKGDLLVHFDLEKIKESGFDTIVPMTVLNSASYQNIECYLGNKTAKEPVLELTTE